MFKPSLRTTFASRRKSGRAGAGVSTSAVAMVSVLWRYVDIKILRKQIDLAGEGGKLLNLI